MASLGQTDEQSRKVNEVLAERLGLDLGDLVSIRGEVYGDAEWVTWEGKRKLPVGFMSEVLAEAARRE